MKFDEVLEILKSNDPRKIQDLIANGELKTALVSARNLSKALGEDDLFNELTLLSSRYADYHRRFIVNRLMGEDVAKTELNQITSGLISLTKSLDDKIKIIINALTSFSQSRHEETKKEISVFLSNADAIDLILKERDVASLIKEKDVALIRSFQESIDSKLSSNTGQNIEPDSQGNRVNIDFRAIFLVASFVVLSLFAAYAFSKGEDYQNMKGLSSDGTFSILLVTNYILHISIISYMILYAFKPIDIDEYVSKKAPNFIKNRFNNNDITLKLFCTRANACVEQFGKWWKYLGCSFLMLYVNYYFIWYFKYLGLNDIEKYEHIIDIVLNASESFFLIILYKILNEDTVEFEEKGSKYWLSEKISNWRRYLVTIALFAALCSISIFFAYINNRENAVLISFVFRALSSIAISITLCLVIGKLDSKFINAKAVDVTLLYAYAAVQLLFVFFDKNLIKELSEIVMDGGIANVDLIDQISKNLKIASLCLVLLLKYHFIQFALKCHSEGKLFNYFLLGSKFNNEIETLSNPKTEVV